MLKLKKSLVKVIFYDIVIFRQSEN